MDLFEAHLSQKKEFLNLTYSKPLIYHISQCYICNRKYLNIFCDILWAKHQKEIHNICPFLTSPNADNKCNFQFQPFTIQKKVTPKKAKAAKLPVRHVAASIAIFADI